MVSSLLQVHVVHLFVGLGSQGQLLELSGLALSLQSLDLVGVALGVVGVQEDTHDINVLVLGEELGSTLVGNLLGLFIELWLKSRLFLSSLVSKVLDRLLLLESVVPQFLEVLLDWSVLSFSDVEQACVFIVDSGLVPLVVLLVVLDLGLLIAFSRNDQKDVLQIFSQNVLVLGALEDSVNVIDQLFLLSVDLWLQESHLVDESSCEVEVEDLLLGVQLFFALQAGAQSLSEFFLKRINSQLVTLAKSELGVSQYDGILFLLLKSFISLLGLLLAELIESMSSWGSSIAWLNLPSKRCFLDGHLVISLQLFHLLILGLLTLLLKTLLVESLSNISSLSVLHHISNLSRQVVELGLLLDLIDFLIKHFLFPLKNFDVLPLQMLLLVSKEAVQIT